MFTLTPSQEAGGLIESAQPLADALSERLGVEVDGTRAVRLRRRDRRPATRARPRSPAGLGPVQMVQAEDEAGAELILQSERFGSFEYVTQWFTNDPDTYCEDEPVADEERVPVLQRRGRRHQRLGRADRRGAPGRRRRPDGRLRRPGLGVGLPRPVAAAAQRRRRSRRGHHAAVRRRPRLGGAGRVRRRRRSRRVVQRRPRRAASSRSPTSASRSWSSPGRSRSPTTASPSAAIFRRTSRKRSPPRSSTSPRPSRRSLSKVYDIDGLGPVDPADFDVIRELRTELADLLE